MNRHKCFADRGSCCGVLTEKLCEYGGCRFYNERQFVDRYIQKKYGVSRREYVRSKYGNELLKYRRRRNEEV